jgi:N-acetylglucosamine-6-sulfatase
VPLVVRSPGVSKGVEQRHLLLNNDLAPTFAELGSVSAPPFVDGRSFVPLLQPDPPSPSNWRSAFLVESVTKEDGIRSRPVFEAVRTEGHLYVEYKSAERELYNLGKDPYELESGHEMPSLGLKRNLSSRLEGLRDCASDGCRNAVGF